MPLGSFDARCVRLCLRPQAWKQKAKRIGGRPDAPVARQLRRAKSGEEFMRERRLVQAVGVIDVLAPTENRAHWSIWRRRQQLGLNATELALALVY